ncbi:MAG: DinB family protein [Cyclobacteriaceae bacterium]
MLNYQLVTPNKISPIKLVFEVYKPEDGFPYYFDLVKDRGLYELYSSQSTFTFLNSINEETASKRYAPDKWSIKQVVGHITDHEKIKTFRAFQLSRTNAVELWGYDQNFLVENSRFDELHMHQLINDLKAVREASLSFINTLSENQLAMKGSARQHQITLADFLKSIIGHEMHHVNIIKEKYL